jgi:predicted ester cyclase
MHLRFDGREGVESQYAASYATFPDLEFVVEGELSDDDTTVQWGRIRGTALGEFIGQPATGKAIDVAMTAVYSFRDGLIASERVYLDLATMATQAGWDLRAIRAALGLDSA